jgi:hypothetical protein
MAALLTRMSTGESGVVAMTESRRPRLNVGLGGNHGAAATWISLTVVCSEPSSCGRPH